MAKMKILKGLISYGRWVEPPVPAAGIQAVVSRPRTSQRAALCPGTRWQT